MRAASAKGVNVAAWRHVSAILLLPVMNTVIIPSVLLALWPQPRLGGAGFAAATLTIGILLGAAGAALVAHSIALFVHIGRGTLAPWDPTRALIAQGAYRYTRNPMKTGLFVLLAGEALATGAAVLAAWFLCFVIANVLYIRLHEEPGLARRFAQPYRDYCARVPRWLPKLTHRPRLTEIPTP